MAKTHAIKVERRFVSDIYSGRKKAEIRYNDRLYQTGDFITFIIVENGIAVSGCDMSPTEELFYRACYEITYVATADCIASNYVVLSIKRVES